MGGNRSSRKGAKGERDIARILSELLGVEVRRMLGAGRHDDIGDLDGLSGWTAQVADRANLGWVLRHKPRECEVQQSRGDTPFGATFVKLPPQPGGKPQEWRVVLTLEQFVEVYDAVERGRSVAVS